MNAPHDRQGESECPTLPPPAAELDEATAAVAAPPANAGASDSPPVPAPSGNSSGVLSTVALTAAPPSARAGRYAPKKFLARGGMGEVWLAHDAEIGRPVAVKMLRTNRHEMRERFLFEAQIAGQLEHPSIVPVHDLAVDADGEPLYVMKLVQGRTFKKALEEFHGNAALSPSERSVAWTRLLETFLDVCHAIAYAHARGVLHRDLKPDNIMLGAFGETVVLDWGLAKLVAHTDASLPVTDDPAYGRISGVRSTTETRAGSVVGTITYLSPEAAEGHIDEIDQASDIFLLGATLFHVLTGEPPRKGSSPTEIIELARNSPIVSPRKLNSQVPKPLAAICLKAMARRKADRYPTALALADDVKRYLAGEPVLAYPEPWHVRAARWARRHRRQLTAAAAALLVAAAGAYGFAKYREAKTEAAAVAAQLALNLQVGQARQDADTARRQGEELQRWAEEARFFAAHVNEADETAPYYDWEAGRQAVQRALALAAGWGPQLEDYPLPQQRRQTIPVALFSPEEEQRDALRRGELKEDLYALLLLDAQMTLNATPDSATTAQRSLEQAQRLRAPTVGFYRLAAQAENRKVGPEADSAPASAWDHFLAGEQLRTGLRAPPDSLETTAGDAYDHDSLSQANRSRFLQAIAAYEAALDLDPDHYWSHFQQARCYLGLGRRAEAQERLAVCIALRPETPWAYNARGLAEALQGRFDEALADLNRALAIDARFRPALLNRGICCLLQKSPQELDRALQDFDALLQGPAETQLVEAAYYRGQLHAQANRIPQAIEDFGLVLQRRPQWRRAYLDRAELHLLQQRPQAALADLDAYLGLAGQGPAVADRAEAHRRRGVLLRRMAQRSPKLKPALLALAREELKRATELDPQAAQAWDELGAAHDQLGEAAQAKAAYAQVLELAPNDLPLRAKTLEKRGWHYANANDASAALDDFQVLLTIDPAQVPWRLRASAWIGLAYGCALQGAEADARRHAQTAADLLLRHRAEDPLARHNLACVYAKLAEREEKSPYFDLAIAQLQTAVHWGETDALRRMLADPALARLRQQPNFARHFPPPAKVAAGE